jgi:hypothetical protein
VGLGIGPRGGAVRLGVDARAVCGNLRLTEVLYRRRRYNTAEGYFISQPAVIYASSSFIPPLSVILCVRLLLRGIFVYE